MKRLFSLFLSICLVMSLTVSATALSPKATNRVDVTVRPNTITRIGTGLSLETDELVTINCTYSPRSADVDFGTINCTYSPRSADVDFGLVSADNEFGYFSGNDGSCRETIRINKTGIYYFAIRNNTKVAVEITGYVYY